MALDVELYGGAYPGQPEDITAAHVEEFLGSMLLAGHTQAGSEVRAAAIVYKGDVDPNGEMPADIRLELHRPWEYHVEGMVGSLLVARTTFHSSRDDFTVNATIHKPGTCLAGDRRTGCRLVSPYHSRPTRDLEPRSDLPTLNMLADDDNQRPPNTLERVIFRNRIVDIGAEPVAYAFYGLQKTGHSLTPLSYEFNIPKMLAEMNSATAQNSTK